MDDRTRADRIGEPVVTTGAAASGTDAHETTQRSASSLIGDALTHMSSLVRKEVDLARAEVSENMTRAIVAIGLLAAALIFALTALNVLAAALVAAIAVLLEEYGIGAGWAALIVGVLFAIIAAIMASKGANDLKGTSLAPTRTAENLRKDRDAVKESL